MNISTEHLVELLSGIARAQAALADAVERGDPGWRNSHLVPILSVAANMRSPDSRLIDLPSRILLRYQGKVAPESAAIVADLERLLAMPAQGPSYDPSAPAAMSPAAARFAAKHAAAPAAAVAPAAAPAPRPAAAPAASAPAQAAPSPASAAAPPRPAAPSAAPGDNLDFSKPS